MRVAAVIVSIAVVLAAVWYFAIRDEGSEDERFGPEVMNSQQLSDWAAGEAGPVYWVGERRTDSFEVTSTEGGNVFVRYLDSATDLGSEDPRFLTVGTYPVNDAWAVTTELSRRDDAVVGQAPDDALVVTTEERPESVYLAYQNGDHQIEVYDPNAERAIRIASSGDVQPVP